MQKWTVKLSFKSHECHSTLPLIKLPAKFLVIIDVLIQLQLRESSRNLAIY